MATTQLYTWQAGDQIWTVAARFLAASGYPDVSTFVGDSENPVDGIRYYNQTLTLPDGTATNVVDWLRIPVGTRIVIPYNT